MKRIMEKIRRLFTPCVWAANDTLVGIHPEGAINCVAGGAIIRNSLVALSSGKVVACAANNRPLGFAQDNAAEGEGLAVRLLGNAAGTAVGIAAEAVAQGDPLYEAANGKVGKTEGGYFIGYAMNAASAGGEVEIQHCVPQAVPASE